MHGNIRLSSIYTSEAGEWKVSGLEVLSNLKEDENAIFVFIPLFTGDGGWWLTDRLMGVCYPSQDDMHLPRSSKVHGT